MEAQRSADGFSWQIKKAPHRRPVQTLAPSYECKWLDGSALGLIGLFSKSWANATAW
jgi:hypothetical protein